MEQENKTVTRCNMLKRHWQYDYLRQLIFLLFLTYVLSLSEVSRNAGMPNDKIRKTKCCP